MKFNRKNFAVRYDYLTPKYVECGYKKAWVLFDLDNGHSYGKNDAGKGYMWVFSTKKQALDHKRSQKSLPNSAKLSKPIKLVL